MSTVSADDAFLGKLRGISDFTLKFEETVLDLSPSCLLIVLAPVAAIYYLQQPVHVRRSPLLWIKLLIAAVLVGVEVASLSFRAASHVLVTETTLAAASVDLVAAVAVTTLLYVEHRRAIRSSALLGLYFFIGVVFDAVKCRSFFIRPGLAPAGALAAASCGLNLLLLTLQEISKRELLIDPELQESLGEEGTAGYWKRMFFTYLNPMFITGYSKVLALQDLSNIGPEFSSKLLHSRLKQHLQGVRWASKNTLMRICFEAWMWLFLLVMIPRLCFTGFSFSQPFILHRVIEILGEPEPATLESTFLLFATILSFAGATLSKMATAHLSYRIVTRLRGALVTQISEKNARLPQVEAKKSAAITLMSTDVDGVANGLPRIYQLIMTFFEVGLGMYFLAGFVGESFFVVLAPLVASTCATYFLGRWIGSAYRVWNKSIEIRVAKTSKILTQLKAINMFGLGPVVSDYLHRLRQVEMIKSKKYRVLEAMASIPVVCAELITPVVVIAAALFWHTLSGRLSAATVFPSLAIIILIKTPLANLLNAYPTLTSMFGCFRRIQEFLQLPEREDPRTLRESPDIAPLDEKADPANPTTWPLVEFVGARIAPPGTQIPILSDVSFSIYPGSITLAIGPNGSGKSLLLQSIIGETSLINGGIYIATILMGFCGQQLWLRNVSIKDNIVGHLPYDERLFRRVVYCCLLEEDLAALPDGENYIVGSGGSKLSGGQRQRVALARALFARMSIVVLDDVFSSLDRKTATSILFRLCGQNGFLQEFNMAAVLTSYLPECLDVADQLLELDGNGSVKVEYSFRSGKSRERALRVMNVPAHAMSEEEAAREQEQLRRSLDTQQPAKAEEPEADFWRKGDPSLYWLFVNPIGKLRLTLWCTAMLFCSAGEMFPDIYMRLWIERDPDNNTYFIGYAGIAVTACLLFSITCAVLFAHLTPRAALGLHEHLVRTLMHATLGFLGRTDNGVLTNRFSQDMSLVARGLPVAFMRTFYVFFTAVIQSGVVVSGASYMAVALPIIFLAIYVIQRFYLRTSRQMRALDLESKSPLYTHFEETAEGLLYIRAFGWQKQTLEEGFSLLDDSQKAFYYMYCIQQWLGLVLGLLITAIATILIAFALFMRGTTSQTAIGLAFLNLIFLAKTFESLILAWTSLETSIGALARLRNFMDKTPQEPSDRHLQVPENWPSLGNIELQNVYAEYSVEPTGPSVLQNVSLSVDGGQKVGVIGRSGSGKSSLLLALLGFLQCKGLITIDGIDISSIPLDVLRSRIVTISQDQIKLDASVRINLLPFTLNANKEEMDEKQRRDSDEKDIKLRELLVRFGIWSHLKDKGGLDAMLDGAGYSHGEMQLFCLARGIMRYEDTGSKVVLIDEATSSVEEERESTAQRIMRDSFPDCTILIIGHRKSSITGVDFTVELSQGRTMPSVLSGITKITGVILHSNGVIIPVITSLMLLGAIPASLIHYAQHAACDCSRQSPRVKLFLSSLLVVIELIALELPVIFAVPCDNEIPSTTFLSLIAAGVVLAVIFAENRRRIDVPDFFNNYLLAGSVLDAAKSICFSHHDQCSANGTLAAVASATRLLLFAFNRQPRTRAPSGRTHHDHSINTLGSDRWGYANFTFFNPMFIFKQDLPTLMGKSGNLNPGLSPKFLHQRLKRSWQQSDQYCSKGLARTCLRTWSSSLTVSVTFRFAYTLFALAQPFVLYGFLAALNRDGTSLQENVKLLCSFGFVLCGKAAMSSAATHALNGLTCRVRGGLTCLVLEKHQNLTRVDAKSSRAEMLFISDIENIAKGLSQVMKLAFVLIDGCLGVYCLCYLVGLSSGVLALSILAAARATLVSGHQIVSSLATWRQDLDTRIWKTSSILKQLSAIKMIGLGPSISNFIEKLHAKELESYQAFRKVQSASELAVAFFSLVTPAAVVGTALLCNTFTATLSPAMLFSTWNLIALQCSPMSAFSQAYSEAIVTLESFGRIQAFLSLDDRTDARALLTTTTTSYPVRTTHALSGRRKAQTPVEAVPHCIEFRNVTITPYGSKVPLYRNVNLSIRRGKIVALVGRRESGKSALLESMLGEAKLTEGFVYVSAGIMAYNSQFAWLKNASVRDNVIGPLSFDSQRFKKVMKCCLLDEDLKKLPGSDGYIVGIGGANLSGGQRHRLALARALYPDPAVLLLDDLFSSLDRRTAASILYRLLGNDGLLRMSGCTVVFATSLVESLDVADQFLTLDIAENSVKLESNTGQAHIANFLLAQHVSAPEALEEREQEALRRTFDARNLPSFNFDRDLVPHTCREPMAFWLLFSSIGKRKLLFWCGLILLICTLEAFSKLNLQTWIDNERNASGFFFGYSCSFLFSCFVGMFLFWTTRIKNNSNASAYLHQRLLQVAMGSTSGFMTDTGSSSIANRFSQSVSHLTGSLPTCLLKLLYCTLESMPNFRSKKLIRGTALTLSCAIILQGPKNLAYVLLALIVCVMRAYVKTSGELRHMKAKEMAPLHTFFQETAAGLVHSRALRWQSHHMEHGFRLIDNQQKAFVYSIYVEEWLQAMASVIACATTMVIAASALFGGGRGTTAMVGLALHQATLLNDLIYETAQSWAIFDDTWAVISDLFLFMKSVPQEHKPPELQLPKEWPTRGRIEYKQVTARYGPGESDVLKDISLTIEPGQKVCLFGRTGSGKTSLLLALLGFLEYEGTIEIDGIDIATIPRQLLRSRIVALSQEPVQLEGSVRFNILSYENLAPAEVDPEEYQTGTTTEFDQELVDILSDMGVWDEIEAQGGMETIVADSGLTKAALQMICFARSVVRYHRSNGVIVLIDEATNGIDAKRDAAVQSAVWEFFEGCTILQVAHIEESIRDAELSVELTKGRITHMQVNHTLPPGVISRSREMLSPESLIGSPGPAPPSPSQPDSSLEDDELSLNREVPPPASDVTSISRVLRQASAGVASLRDSIMSPRRVLALAKDTKPPSTLGLEPARAPTQIERSLNRESCVQGDDEYPQTHTHGFRNTQFGNAQQPMHSLPQLFHDSFPVIEPPTQSPIRAFHLPDTYLQQRATGQVTGNGQLFSGVERPLRHRQNPFLQQDINGQHQMFLRGQQSGSGIQLHGQQVLHEQQPLYGQQAVHGQHSAHGQQGLHEHRSPFGKQPFHGQQTVHTQQAVHSQKAVYAQHGSHEQVVYGGHGNVYGHPSNMVNHFEPREGDEASYSRSYSTGSGSTYLRPSIETGF
ncbi:hypothetical protein LLEC1_02682 [Akanthomyces lecanii]|uniref:Uncharacterized protein n=1 Tax=Cordyceps confragosa TaxID=2714763 RepID=A0A179IVE0_CORDF|nr:hypothetical protein LLEC1_02682 [Akanthomyces lecanii]